MELQAAKAALRTHYRALRRDLDPGWVRSAGAAMTARVLGTEAVARAGAVFIFVSMPGEPETRPLIEALLARGKRVHVPRCSAQRRMELVRITGLSDLEPGYYGIEEPRKGLPEVGAEAIDLALLPALAVGLDGSRLGQGGGYYDRFLARYHGAATALCFEAFVAQSLPMGPLDRPVTHLITEARDLVL